MKGKAFEVTMLSFIFFPTIFVSALVLLIATDEMTDVERTVSAIIFVIVIVLYIALLFAIYKTNIHTILKSSPEKHEQVKVIGKRLKRDVTHAKGYVYTVIVDCIVSFKFADGSVKELTVGEGDGYESIYKRGEPVESEFVKGICNEIWESIQEGNTGILTYKERENIKEKIPKKENHYKGRLFISFVKDSPERMLKHLLM